MESTLSEQTKSVIRVNSSLFINQGCQEKTVRSSKVIFFSLIFNKFDLAVAYFRDVGVRKAERGR